MAVCQSVAVGELVEDLLDDGPGVAVRQLEGREQTAPAVAHGEDPSFALPGRSRFARVLRVQARCDADFVCGPRRHFLEVGRSQPGVVQFQLGVDGARGVREQAGVRRRGACGSGGHSAPLPRMVGNAREEPQ